MYLADSYAVTSHTRGIITNGLNAEEKKKRQSGRRGKEKITKVKQDTGKWD